MTKSKRTPKVHASPSRTNNGLHDRLRSRHSTTATTTALPHPLRLPDLGQQLLQLLHVRRLLLPLLLRQAVVWRYLRQRAQDAFPRRPCVAPQLRVVALLQNLLHSLDAPLQLQTLHLKRRVLVGRSAAAAAATSSRRNRRLHRRLAVGVSVQPSPLRQHATLHEVLLRERRHRQRSGLRVRPVAPNQVLRGLPHGVVRAAGLASGGRVQVLVEGRPAADLDRLAGRPRHRVPQALKKALVLGRQPLRRLRVTLVLVPHHLAVHAEARRRPCRVLRRAVAVEVVDPARQRRQLRRLERLRLAARRGRRGGGRRGRGGR
eukprot:Rhum_TRINITY_DN10530_c0_g1::Rhum_TRINITY_DN10530_c0_g1_i1::g.38927::m.38927